MGFHNYYKVESSRLSWLVAHPRVFRLLMKGKFALWHLTKSSKIWKVDRSTARNFTVFICKWIHRGIVKLHNSKYINRGCPAVVSGLCILFSPPAGHVKSNGRSEENSFTPIFGHNVPASLAALSGRAAQRCPSLPVLLDAQLLIPFLFLKGALFRRLLCLKASSFKSSKWCDSLDIPTLSVSEPKKSFFVVVTLELCIFFMPIFDTKSLDKTVVQVISNLIWIKKFGIYLFSRMTVFVCSRTKNQSKIHT